jgi:hypothetical protein
MPLLFAGGVCCCVVGVPFSVAAGFDEPLEVLAGALEGAGAGVGAGLELELALEEPDAEPEAELDAG